MANVRHFKVPTDRVLSYDEFRELVESQMTEQQSTKTSASAVSASASNGQQQETATQRAHREIGNARAELEQLMRQRRENEQRAGLQAPPRANANAGNIFAGPGGPPGQQPPVADFEGMLRFFPQALQFIPLTIFRVARWIAGLGAAVLPYLGALVMIGFMVGFDDTDGRLWRIIAFFAVLKFARVIAERVRLNVVVPDQQPPAAAAAPQLNGEQQNNNNNGDAAAAAGGGADGNPVPAGPPKFTTAQLFKKRLVKCATVFIVSLSPSFRLERLLRELHEEGIAFD